MATNKNAQLRYNALDKCFSNFFKKYFINDLIEHCANVLTEHYATATSVSRRQILDDIDFMRSEAGFDAPIESIKEGKKVFYRYADASYSIGNKPLNPSELDTLQRALFTLNRMNNIPGFEWVNSLQTKLHSELGLQENHNKVIDFEENEFLKGLHHLYPLYQYICNKQSLTISYQSFKADVPTDFLLSPLYLKQYNNRWFLLSLGHLYDSVFTLAIDRILEISLSSESYRDTTINFDEYFEDIIGVTNYEENPLETVRIALSPNIIPYIKSKPLHGSQKINENILTLHLKLNFEFEGLILSYGENMKVLEPLSLQEKLKLRIANSLKNY